MLLDDGCHFKIAVVGAGPAGLTAAIRMAELADDEDMVRRVVI